jgi:hypothetical protein
MWVRHVRAKEEERKLGLFFNFSSRATRGSDLNVSDGAGIALGFSKSEISIGGSNRDCTDRNLHLGIFPVFLASIKSRNDVLHGAYDLMPMPES